MMRTNRHCIGMAVFAMVVLLSGAAFARSGAADVKEITYKTVGDRELKLYVNYPPGWKPSDTRPAIVFFFGGAWRSGSVAQFAVQADYLARRGLVAARADYRIKNKDGVTPDKCVEDARSAVR